jgi:LysR family transcriptional regulator, carnitine catabolism transcriptional activator
MIEFTSRQLRAFLLVARHRSFTRAAGALFITPSGLSVLIRELEGQLGTRLFERTTRQVSLTAAGNGLLAVAQRNLEELYGTMSRLRVPTGPASPRLSVGAPPLWAAGALAQAIKEFRSRGSDLRFNVFDSDSAAIFQRVESGTLDVGLGNFFKHIPGIRRTPLFRFSLMLIRSNTSRASRRASTSWAALKGERLVTLQPSLPIQQFIGKHLTRAGIVDQPDSGVNYLGTLIAMVEAGEGVAIVPSFALPECRKRGLLASRLVNPSVALDIHQIRKGGRVLAPAAEEFTSFLQSFVPRWARESGML